MQPAQRHLVLLRHAKSAWPNGVPDLRRPLAKRGRRDAAAVGRWLHERAPRLDAVVCSPAERARQTLDAGRGRTRRSPARFLRRPRWPRPSDRCSRPDSDPARGGPPAWPCGRNGPKAHHGGGTLPLGRRCRPWCPGLCPPPARHLRPGDAGIGVAEGRPWKQPFRPVRPGVWHPCHQLAVLQRREPRHTSASARVLLPWPRA